jgi:hypothetical protein
MISPLKAKFFKNKDQSSNNIILKNNIKKKYKKIELFEGEIKKNQLKKDPNSARFATLMTHITSLI